MKIYTRTTLLLMTLLTMGCNNTATTEANNTGSTIELNDGNKWEVNAEMSPFILNGEKILQEYTGTDYAMLAEQLAEQNAQLISSCTMSGESHNQLHAWLMPHLKLVDALKKTVNENEAKKNIADLKTSFLTYHKYFK
jgi:hypothetical protein